MKRWKPLERVRAAKASRNVEKLIRFARDEMIIVCGALNPAVYETAHVVSATQEAIEREVSFKILVGPQFDTNRKSEFVSLTRPGIKIASKRPPVHFAVCDRQNVRFEGWHKPGGTIPLNNVLWGNAGAAEKMVALYEKILETAEADGVTIESAVVDS